MRRLLDRYDSAAMQIPPLLRHITIAPNSVVFEPCSGTGVIVKTLKEFGIKARFITNDIDKNTSAMFHYDATSPTLWDKMKGTPLVGRPDWVITNPPFNEANKILPLALLYAKVGVALQLRLSFVEPCEGREDIVYNNPPNKQIVLPRYSFTGDGVTDKVTTAWFVWEKEKKEWVIVSYPRAILTAMFSKKSLHFVDLKEAIEARKPKRQYKKKRDLKVTSILSESLPQDTD